MDGWTSVVEGFGNMDDALKALLRDNVRVGRWTKVVGPLSFYRRIRWELCLYSFCATRWAGSFCPCGAVSSGGFSSVVLLHPLDLLRDQAWMKLMLLKKTKSRSAGLNAILLQVLLSMMFLGQEKLVGCWIKKSLFSLTVKYWIFLQSPGKSIIDFLFNGSG